MGRQPIIGRWELDHIPLVGLRGKRPSGNDGFPRRCVAVGGPCVPGEPRLLGKPMFNGASQTARQGTSLSESESAALEEAPPKKNVLLARSLRPKLGDDVHAMWELLFRPQSETDGLGRWSALRWSNYTGSD